MQLLVTSYKSFLFIVITASLFPNMIFAAGLSQGQQDTIYIGQLQVQSSVTESAAKMGRLTELKSILQSLDSQFISALNATRVFQLVERKRKGDLELEQGFAAVTVDPNDKNAAQAGKMAGAKFAFLPQVDGFDDLTETIEQTAIGRTAIERKLFLSVIVQVVETTTGKLLPDSPSVQLNRTESVSTRQGQTGNQVVVELAKEAAQKLSQELVALLRPAKVLAITGKNVTINRGLEAGFQNGDLLEIFATKEVKDDDTGEMFREEVSVGKATIIRTDKKQSTATISDDDFGIAKGCIVRTSRQRLLTISDNNTTPGSSDKPVKW